MLVFIAVDEGSKQPTEREAVLDELQVVREACRIRFPPEIRR